MSIATDFFRIFAGLTRSHGRYALPAGAKPDGNGKLHDTKWAWTEPGPLSEALFEEHLLGGKGLGVVPIRDDGTCLFAAIDWDDYTLDIKRVVAMVVALNLPLIVCRTKSGGVHLYLFFRTPCPAPLVRAKLKGWALLLGCPSDVEIFPKQDELTEAAKGNWINLPYHAGSRSTRYAFGPDGNALTPEQFVEAVANEQIDEAYLNTFKPAGKDADWFEGGPPCLITLAARSFGDWQNNSLCNMATYLKKRFPDDWALRLPEYNAHFLSPPAPAMELANVLKSYKKKDYSYMCKQQPICAVCDKKVCKTTKFGVGGERGLDSPEFILGQLVKLETEPVIWLLEIDGKTMECSTADLMDQRKFHALTMENLNRWPLVVKPSAWQKMVQDRLQSVDVQKVPVDATQQGQFWVHLSRFCTSNVRGKSLDEILLGKPFTENGRTYFQGADFFQYLQQHRFNVSEKKSYGWLRERGLESHGATLKGKFINYWSVEAFPEQTEEHSIPRTPTPEAM